MECLQNLINKFGCLVFLLIGSSCAYIEPIEGWRDLNKKEKKTAKQWDLQRIFEEAINKKLESHISFEKIESTDGKVDGFKNADQFLKYECLYKYRNHFLDTDKYRVEIGRGRVQYERNNATRMIQDRICSQNVHYERKLDCEKAET